jgi:hypothetical protein
MPQFLGKKKEGFLTQNVLRAEKYLFEDYVIEYESVSSFTREF